MKASKILFLTLLLTVSVQARAQQDSAFPDQLTLIDQDGFYKVMALAGTSFLLSELLFKESNEHYYQARASYFANTKKLSITGQSFGIEKRLSHWFGIGAETHAQQWCDRGKSGFGLGLNGYYRWYAFGKKRLSPFFEFGTGAFYGFSPLPTDGTKFTFYLTSAFGLEYDLKNKNKLRMTWGHLHQSNNGLLEPNPGLDATGISITYLWRWKKER